MKFYSLILLFLVMGCANHISPLRLHALPSALLEDESNIFATYHVTFYRKESSDNFLMHLEIFPDHFSLVGLGSLGEILFECRYNKNQAEKCDTLLKGIPAVMLLQDIELIFWPLDELNINMKNSNFVLTDTSQRRLLFYKQDIFLEITYENERSLQSRIKLDNKKYNYQLHIEPLHIKKEIKHE